MASSRALLICSRAARCELLEGRFSSPSRSVIEMVPLPLKKHGGAQIVRIGLEVKDSSGDPVTIEGSYQVCPCDGVGAWSEAAHAGAPPPPVEALRGGQKVNFFWDVRDNLGATAHEVRLRFRVSDGLRDAWAETLSFQVENNQKPVATILAEEFLANPDRRRGIPVRFEVSDAESHPVDVVFQWRLAGTSFPDLPATPEEVRDVLADPERRRELQIATERPAVFEGLVVAVDPASDPDGAKVRLPGLRAPPRRFSLAAWRAASLRS